MRLPPRERAGECLLTVRIETARDQSWAPQGHEVAWAQFEMPRAARPKRRIARPEPCSVETSGGEVVARCGESRLSIDRESGGALVNSEGGLIGITSAIGVSQAGPEGIGYAVPVELAMRIADEIIETGDVAHPFLGVTIGTFLDEASDGATIPSGSDIQSIEGTGSAAGEAGLQAGDIIVRIGDKEITSQTDLILAVRLYRVGDEVEFVALRDDELKTFTVVLGQRPTEFGG